MESQNDLVKIAFKTDPNGLGQGVPERLWAQRLADDKRYFELKNSPFYAKGISYLDIVEATEIFGELHYLRTVCPSGNSTYRVLVDKNSTEFLEQWRLLEKMGCTYEYSEEGPKLLYAIDVPSTSNIFEIYKILEKGEMEAIWFFDEGHYSCPTKKRDGEI